MKGGRKFLGVKHLLSLSQALWSGIGLEKVIDRERAEGGAEEVGQKEYLGS